MEESRPLFLSTFFLQMSIKLQVVDLFFLLICMARDSRLALL